MFKKAVFKRLLTSDEESFFYTAVSLHTFLSPHLCGGVHEAGVAQVGESAQARLLAVPPVVRVLVAVVGRVGREAVAGVLHTTSRTQGAVKEVLYYAQVCKHKKRTKNKNKTWSSTKQMEKHTPTELHLI